MQDTEASMSLEKNISSDSESGRATKRAHNDVIATIQALLADDTVADVSCVTGIQCQTTLMRLCYVMCDLDPLVDMLQGHEVDVSCQDTLGRTLAMHACLGQCLPLLNFALSRGADLITPDLTRSNLLHHGAGSGNGTIVDRLLEHPGADKALKVLNAHGYSPMDIARQRKYPNIARKLSAFLKPANQQNNSTSGTTVPNRSTPGGLTAAVSSPIQWPGKQLVKNRSRSIHEQDKKINSKVSEESGRQNSEPIWNDGSTPTYNQLQFGTSKQKGGSSSNDSRSGGRNGLNVKQSEVTEVSSGMVGPLVPGNRSMSTMSPEGQNLLQTSRPKSVRLSQLSNPFGDPSCADSLLNSGRNSNSCVNVERSSLMNGVGHGGQFSRSSHPILADTLDKNQLQIRPLGSQVPLKPLPGVKSVPPTSRSNPDSGQTYLGKDVDRSTDGDVQTDLTSDGPTKQCSNNTLPQHHSLGQTSQSVNSMSKLTPRLLNTEFSAALSPVFREISNNVSSVSKRLQPLDPTIEGNGQNKTDVGFKNLNQISSGPGYSTNDNDNTATADPIMKSGFTSNLQTRMSVQSMKPVNHDKKLSHTNIVRDVNSNKTSDGLGQIVRAPNILVDAASPRRAGRYHVKFSQHADVMGSTTTPVNDNFLPSRDARSTLTTAAETNLNIVEATGANALERTNQRRQVLNAHLSQWTGRGNSSLMDTETKRNPDFVVNSRNHRELNRSDFDTADQSCKCDALDRSFRVEEQFTKESTQHDNRRVSDWAITSESPLFSPSSNTTWLNKTSVGVGGAEKSLNVSGVRSDDQPSMPRHGMRHLLGRRAERRADTNATYEPSTDQSMRRNRILDNGGEVEFEEEIWLDETSKNDRNKQDELRLADLNLDSNNSQSKEAVGEETNGRLRSRRSSLSLPDLHDMTGVLVTSLSKPTLRLPNHPRRSYRPSAAKARGHDLVVNVSHFDAGRCRQSFPSAPRHNMAPSDDSESGDSDDDSLAYEDGIFDDENLDLEGNEEKDSKKDENEDFSFSNVTSNIERSPNTGLYHPETQVKDEMSLPTITGRARDKQRSPVFM